MSNLHKNVLKLCSYNSAITKLLKHFKGIFSLQSSPNWIHLCRW